MRYHCATPALRTRYTSSNTVGCQAYYPKRKITSKSQTPYKYPQISQIIVRKSVESVDKALALNHRCIAFGITKQLIRNEQRQPRGDNAQH